MRLSLVGPLLFSKILTMTKDVHLLKEQLVMDKFPEYQLRQKIVELKHMGKSDEAKTLLDEHLKNNVFAELLVYGRSVESVKEKVEECLRKYEK